MKVYGQIYQIEFGKHRYVGQTISGCCRRWQQHITKLESGCHHNHHLQGFYDENELRGILFSVLESGVKKKKLDQRELRWNEELEAVSAKPWKAVKKRKQKAVLGAIDSGMTYREISKSFGISLGAISQIKARSK